MRPQTSPEFWWLYTMKMCFSSYQVQIAWGSERPPFCAVIRDSGSISFVAPVGSPSPFLDLLPLLANTGREKTVEGCVGDFRGHSWDFCTSLLPTLHWPNLSPVATPCCREGWEMPSNGVHRPVLPARSVPGSVGAERMLSKLC